MWGVCIQKTIIIFKLISYMRLFVKIIFNFAQVYLDYYIKKLYSLNSWNSNLLLINPFCNAINVVRLKFK